MAFEDELAAYRASRERITALVSSLGPDDLSATVTCCPKWTAKDLVGHLTGVLEDRVAQHLPTSGLEGWTDDQVARHRGQALDEVLGRWHGLALEPSDAAPSLSALAFDAVTHEHDLFQALGRPGDRETHSVLVGARLAADRAQRQLGDDDAAPCLVVVTEDGERRLGGGGASIALHTSRFALLRLVPGRMSDREARSLDWDADPQPLFDRWFADGFFALQPVDVLGGT